VELPELPLQTQRQETDQILFLAQLPLLAVVEEQTELLQTQQTLVGLGVVEPMLAGQQQAALGILL
jgi:hypothetical protein